MTWFTWMLNNAAAPLPGLRKPRLSRLLRDILLVNLLPVALIFAALFYLDQYQQGLLAAEVSALREQARIYAGALAQSAVQDNQANQPALDPDLAQPLLYQLIEPTPNAGADLWAGWAGDREFAGASGPGRGDCDRAFAGGGAAGVFLEADWVCV
jgi:hypothetical protein